ncbi:hypothetical protein [Burkholderia cenocepacia]|uniref:hypothetical protein n=1 Tax=Burkholderia cenocepacia TaxID=95486 RepID=UPI0016399A49|nr:hypothetical protein [Burkholderia cenocepacia]
MKRITKDMVKAGGHRFCCECSARGPRVKAHWTHKGRDYCDMHKPVVLVEQRMPVVVR